MTISWPIVLKPEAPSPMVLLEGGIPLSLLIDLICGPRSADLLDHEAPLPSLSEPRKT